MSRLDDLVRRPASRYPYLYTCMNKRKWRCITSYLRALPDFIVIGAQKSGTTSLYDLIIKHSDIAPSIEKELHYFSFRYKYGSLLYRSNFPTRMSQARHEQKTGQRLLTGEASPSYLYYPGAARRMKELVPDVLLICILRNPVDRAYSHYHHTIRRGHEPLSFQDALTAEEKRCGSIQQSDPQTIAAKYRLYSYRAGGVYADHLVDWFRYYDRSQFLFLTTEELRVRPHQTLDQVFRFLGASPFQLGSTRDLNVGHYEEMDLDIRRELVEHFRSHNARLSRMLGRNFEWDR